MTMPDEFDLDRFVSAQDDHATFERAVTELRSSRKRSHWMWFVFPQLYGLGQSATSLRYGIRSLDEARAYLNHPILGPRLVEAADVVAALQDVTATDVFGGVDAVKLHSSMTLFARASPEQVVFTEVLDHFFGGRPDAATLRLLATD